MSRDNKGYWKDKYGKYHARIYENGTRKYLGAYDTEREAMDVYLKACNEKLIRSVAAYGHILSEGILYKKYYIVFDNGDIFSTTGTKIKPNMNIHGYLHCHINDDDETIHRIIATCFIPNPYNKPCINHINGIKTDNRADNLEWCNQSENIQHAYNTGLRTGPYGEQNGRSRLTEDDVRYIRQNYIPRDSEYGIYALAKKFDVHKNTIYDIVHNKKWKYISQL